jgi:hypothetical protein
VFLFRNHHDAAVREIFAAINGPLITLA